MSKKYFGNNIPICPNGCFETLLCYARDKALERAAARGETGVTKLCMRRNLRGYTARFAVRL